MSDTFELGAVARFAGSPISSRRGPGAYAPGFMLPPAAQAD
jgi:hypothetical protein